MKKMKRRKNLIGTRMEKRILTIHYVLYRQQLIRRISRYFIAMGEELTDFCWLIMGLVWLITSTTH